MAVNSYSDITGNPELARRGGPKYAAHMLRVYKAVTAMGSLNFSKARIQLPSNIHFKESPADALMVEYLKFGFPTGYEGPMSTPATGNHTSTLDVVAYLQPRLEKGQCWDPLTYCLSPNGAR